ncbi:MAG: tRNA pseudouridine(38-40) synthase TruA [Clostridia bacterium]|nr:tRNA pseudouridine(38-40) synthase TruA [Clostridia bacterium]
MKRVLLCLAFDGTNYHGWQFQPNAVTVQSILNESLEKLLGVPTNITGCSRTDAGVHAKQFFCHIDCADNIPREAFLKGLNSILPNDIAVIDYREVDKNFHARYSAKGKRYVYGMYYGDKEPFDERYYYRIDSIPDIRSMNEFAATLIGEHDFQGFSSSGRSVENTIRNVNECVVTHAGNKVYFSISANGFLYNMVRILAGTALAVGLGKLPSRIANSVFNDKNRSLAGDTLPPHGLFLEEVFY